MHVFILNIEKNQCDKLLMVKRLDFQVYVFLAFSWRSWDLWGRAGEGRGGVVTIIIAKTKVVVIYWLVQIPSLSALQGERRKGGEWERECVCLCVCIRSCACTKHLWKTKLKFEFILVQKILKATHNFSIIWISTNFLKTPHTEGMAVGRIFFSQIIPERSWVNKGHFVTLKVLSALKLFLQWTHLTELYNFFSPEVYFIQDFEYMLVCTREGVSTCMHTLDRVSSHCYPLSPARQLAESWAYAHMCSVFLGDPGSEPTVGHMVLSTAVHFATNRATRLGHNCTVFNW